MSLRARLTLFFVVIVVLPVTAVTAYGWQAVARFSQRQVRSELELARRSATAAFLARVERANEAKLQGRDRVVTAGPRLPPPTARPGQVKGRAARVE